MSADRVLSVAECSVSVVEGGGRVAGQGGRRLRPIADPFVVAAPCGARIRARLRPTAEEERVLRAVAAHLGAPASRDLAVRVRAGQRGQDTRAGRKRELTAGSSSRWAGAITRTSEDAYQAALRNLRAATVQRRRVIAVITRRLAAPIGGRAGGVRGYANGHEHAMKRARLQHLQADLARAGQQVASGRPSVVRGGRVRAKRLAEAKAGDRERLRREWQAARWFFTADGESGETLRQRDHPHQPRWARWGGGDPVALPAGPSGRGGQAGTADLDRPGELRRAWPGMAGPGGLRSGGAL
jgi:hypothetical protein